MIPNLSKIVLIICFIGIAIELYLSVARRSQPGAISKDVHSLKVIWIVNSFAIALGIIAFYRLHACQLPWPNLCIILGSCLVVFGLALRWYSVIYLGRFFTTKVSIAANHQLIDTGPYRFIRHPSYTGIFLAVLGCTLCLQNWATLLIVFIPRCIVTLWRIHVEETALLDALGDQYRNYMNRTKRLIPLVY